MSQRIDPAKLQQVADGLLTGLTPAQLQEIVDLYERGYSGKKIGPMFGVSWQTVLAVLRKLGVEIRRGGAPTVLTPAIKAETRKLLDQGVKRVAIGAIVGVSPSTIRDAITRGDL